MGGLLNSAWCVFRGFLVALAIWILFGLAMYAAITFIGSPTLTLTTVTTAPEWMAASLLVGALGEFAGGWQAAKLAGRAHLAHAGALGLALLIVGFSAAVLTRAPMDAMGIAGNLISVPAALAGGFVARAHAPAAGAD